MTSGIFRCVWHTSFWRKYSRAPSSEVLQLSTCNPAQGRQLSMVASSCGHQIDRCKLRLYHVRGGSSDSVPERVCLPTHVCCFTHTYECASTMRTSKVAVRHAAYSPKDRCMVITHPLTLQNLGWPRLFFAFIAAATGFSGAASPVAGLPGVPSMMALATARVLVLH